MQINLTDFLAQLIETIYWKIYKAKQKKQASYQNKISNHMINKLESNFVLFLQNQQNQINARKHLPYLKECSPKFKAKRFMAIQVLLNVQ